MTLRTPITQLPSIGPTTTKRLSYLGIYTAADLLHHYPFRYDDFSVTKDIRMLADGEVVTICARVELVNNKRSHRARMMITEVIVADDTGQMKLTWFRQPYIAKQLKVGEQYYFSGKVKDSVFGCQMTNPTFEKISRDPERTARIVPIYPTTAGLSQKQLAGFVSVVLDLADSVEEWIPETFLDAVDTISLPEAIRGVHQPSSQEHLSVSLRRMKFDELLLHQLRAERIRQSVTDGIAPVLVFEEERTKAFVAQLPFALTGDQKVAAWQILQDLERSVPMNRLLEGDVGSGKTVVAALVANHVVQSGSQVAIMAPTAILAEQHFASFTELFPDGTVIALKTSDRVELHNYTFQETTKAGQKREFVSLLADGIVQIAIGTHALITPTVQFADLALAIVDEQHRFGVGQRKMLKDRSGPQGYTPHFLSMTATPIPRSYALALYGDLDISLIKTMPAGRKPVITKRVEAHERQSAYDFIRIEIQGGRQAFVICPMIESDGEAIDEKKSVMTEYETLSTTIFPDLRVGYVHGKLKAEIKQSTMEAFARGELDILVSTSVIEVGVNIPNASVMIIEGADRFGLAQLHQFRGRVGRSSHQSYCFLCTDSLSTSVQERLDFFCSTTDGFKVAEYDLDMRGPGEVYGTQQSGEMQFQFASLADTDLIAIAQQCVRGIDFSLYPQLDVRVRAWEENIHLE
jgi:ATP-dependent DNA helicase RecG